MVVVAKVVGTVVVVAMVVEGRVTATVVVGSVGTMTV